MAEEATVATAGPLHVNSVYRHAAFFVRADGAMFFHVPERVGFEYDDDYVVHIANGSEYLWDLAVHYYSGVRGSPVDLWEAIAMFQPEPIQDPSVPLPQGKEVFIPSADFIEEVLQGPSLADTPDL